MSQTDSSDEEVEFELDFLLYNDIQPTPQDDGPDRMLKDKKIELNFVLFYLNVNVLKNLISKKKKLAVAPIAYPADYKKAMDIFRTITTTNEQSKRTLYLTEFIIRLNPAHYTIWKFRENLVKKGVTEINEELNFTEALGKLHPKSYQIWHHRQWLVNNYIDLILPIQEIEFINRLLKYDTKNYHAWSYRQWLVQKFNLFKLELEETEGFILDDIRNNSAWNQRYFVFKMREEGFQNETDFENEINYCISKIKLAPRNESPWNYIRGIIKLFGKNPAEVKVYVSLCEDYFQKNLPISNALISLLEILENKIKSEKNDDFQSEALQICDKLIDFDYVRRNYWTYRKQLLLDANSH
ncbi:hypothetical protein HK099_004808 [Clydaea vesicula]|uniref:Protein farnesyltransferase/geranylgeranyltransferase type-1 subunit alpha n=1 Tax=Clydaea vesicula TaxID=447962 RepID=A0AAD5XVD2_9FUNG|nr:hypothetical protein HK099_004808 [Clydaea vesicula]